MTTDHHWHWGEIRKKKFDRMDGWRGTDLDVADFMRDTESVILDTVNLKIRDWGGIQLFYRCEVEGCTDGL